MQNRKLLGIVVLIGSLFAGSGCGSDAEETGGTGGTPPSPYAANLCVASKQSAAGAFCAEVFGAWTESGSNDMARLAEVAQAQARLDEAWSGAEAEASAEGVDCADLAWSSEAAGDDITRSVDAIAIRVRRGLDQAQQEAGSCGGARLGAAAEACRVALQAESQHVADLGDDPSGERLSAERELARQNFLVGYDQTASADCPLGPSASMVLPDVEALIDATVLDTIVSPGLDDEVYVTLTPGPTEYLGRTYTPQCIQGSEYRYFARRGATNKLLIYYQGGGACWNALTCGLPSCRAKPEDNLDTFAVEGFFDLDNPANPFRDWNIVFVSYCSCDIHFGDASVAYTEGEEPALHFGFHNAKVAEKWAREHFLNPEVVFVTGSSAGAFGAWFHGPLLHEVWPASQFHVLADAGNGVITEDFLENEFTNWNFVPNLPEVPGVNEAITEGGGMPEYTEAIAVAYPDTNWAHYSTLFDGSPGGQSGFYNVMLNEGGPADTLTWWEASCAFGDVALRQSEEIAAAVPANYRYYFGTGTEHTVFRNDKVYSDTTGGVPSFVDWINPMLASGPQGRDTSWTNVLCEDCGLLLEEDPRPAPLQAPFVERGDDVVVECLPQSE